MSKITGDEATWEGDFRRGSYLYQLSNRNRFHSLMPQVLDRIERRIKKRLSIHEKDKTKRGVMTELKTMRAAGFQNPGKHPWISSTRIRMLEVVESIRWRYPTLPRNLWSFTLAKTGCAGIMFQEPMLVALFIARSWPDDWRLTVKLQGSEDEPQPFHLDLYQSRNALVLKANHRKRTLSCTQ